MAALSGLSEIGSGLVGALIPTIGSIYLAVSARRTSRQSTAQRVDGQAYDRAQKINERIVADLEAQVERLRKELVEMRDLLRTAKDHSDELERKVAELEATVEHMSELLAQHNIDPQRRT